MRERVIIIPAVNVLGVNTRSRPWPFDKIDINCMFPGREDGETTQRIAAAVLNVTRSAYYRVDVHASNLDIEEMPQVRLYDPNDDERATACLFGLPAVIERPLNKVFVTTLLRAWRRFGGENFVIQGLAGNLQTNHCEQLFRGLVAFLDRTGIVEGLTLAEDEEDLRYFNNNQTFAVLSDHAGFFVSRRVVGRWIQAGDLIGHIYDSFAGTILTEVRAPVGGLVCSLRRQPLLFQGDLLARILTLHESNEAMALALRGRAERTLQTFGREMPVIFLYNETA
ncbi:MAG: succinylglutamate desuccinylase/aspartoacylase family protein [Gammaproteobacteria bacterium]|nr:succinylglutamate desuccinylase/aspartoacylase family protein [Gammaproteobacteria bacterium]